MDKRIIKVISSPRYLGSVLLHRLDRVITSDTLYLKLEYYFQTGRKLNLKHPKTFNEKLQWLKIHDHNPLYTKMVDKLAVKSLIANTIGGGYGVRELGVWRHFDDIDFSVLPQQFVLKCTHDSGGLVICKDKNRLDKAAAKRKIEKCLRKNYFYGTREWPYKNVEPRIIAEEYLQQADGEELRDYKVMCFNGKAKLIELHMNRHSDHHTQDFYDTSWQKTSISQGHGYGGTSNVNVPKPECLDEMLNLSELLTKNMAHCRVDWYIVNGKLYFGELTFFDGSGYELYDDDNDDLLLGSWIDLSVVPFSQ